MNAMEEKLHRLLLAAKSLSIWLVELELSTPKCPSNFWEADVRLSYLCG